MQERRQDIGLKLGYFILTAIIAGMLSIFFWGTYSKAEKAYDIGTENKQETAVLNNIVMNMADMVKQINFKIDKALIYGGK